MGSEQWEAAIELIERVSPNRDRQGADDHRLV